MSIFFLYLLKRVTWGGNRPDRPTEAYGLAYLGPARPYLFSKRSKLRFFKKPIYLNRTSLGIKINLSSLTD